MNPGESLRLLRARKPLVHNITNYVVMNETANAILALGALPVMAHAREEVEEMVGLAGALVLNIGTLSEAWIEAMVAAGAAANARGVPVVLDPVGAGATRYRTETATAVALIASVAQHTGLQVPGPAADRPAAMRATEPSVGVREVFEELEHRVRRATGGRAGLAELVPLALTAWAVTEVVRGRAAPLAWSSALWYAHGLYRDYTMTPRE